MDVSRQVTALEEEVALLKAEIKAVLREIRTAVLNTDNPFSANTGAVAAATDSPAAQDPQASPKVDIPSSPTPLPPVGPPAGPAPPSVSPGVPPGAPPGAPPQPQAVPGQSSARPIDSTTPGATPSPSADQSTEQVEADAGSPRQPGRLHLLTIAGLMSWAEEAVGTLGTERFEIVLELGAATDLISPESRDVLTRIAKLVPSTKRTDEPMNVIECVVVLRQLEAILQGENIAKIPLRRSAAQDEAA